MQVVIDVPNWLYFAILEHKEPIYSQSLGDAVRDGTPLPKGHGKLIDADALYADLTFPTQQFAKAFRQILDDAPTMIIPTDKEGD